MRVGLVATVRAGHSRLDDAAAARALGPWWFLATRYERECAVERQRSDDERRGRVFTKPGATFRLSNFEPPAQPERPRYVRHHVEAR